MYFLSFFLIVLAFFISAGSTILLAIPLWKNVETFAIAKAEYGFNIILGFFFIISFVLLQSLITSDFTLVYTASYTDLILPLFYKITGFWAGQAGSLLFWLISILVFNLCFIRSSNYKELNQEIQSWYWIFFYIFVAFFCFLLVTWNNPFVIQTPAPADGNGLNPLLQNVAMIIHPPLLLMGYAGFVIPASLAFAYMLSNTPDSVAWMERIRTPFIITWIFLSSGILLGGWWAYMELGWGGYWAWDPVENASFIPWLIATAYIHTALVETHRNKLHRTNFFLMALTALSTIFATYIVRGGVVESVHAFPGAVGTPLLVFVLLGIAIALYVAFLTPIKNEATLDGINSKEALLVLMSWLLLASGAIIIVATLWPVFSKAFTAKSIGLDANFYNDVVLPLFIVITILLSICYAMTWKKGLRPLKELAIPSVLAVISIAISYFAGYTKPTALLGIGSAVAVLYTSKILFFPSQYKFLSRRYIASTCTHLGFAIIVFGIAFSGPFKATQELELTVGQSVPFEGYEVKYEKFQFETTKEFTFYKAFLTVTKDGKPYGTLTPEKRLYPKYQSMSFAEASTIPTLYKELYASLLNVTKENKVFINISVEPFVNWIWIGSFILCFAPLISLRSRKEEKALMEKEE